MSSWSGPPLLGRVRAQVAERRLDTIERTIPETFYAHLGVERRVERIVALWQRAIGVIATLEGEEIHGEPYKRDPEWAEAVIARWRPESNQDTKGEA